MHVSVEGLEWARGKIADPIHYRFSQTKVDIEWAEMRMHSNNPAKRLTATTTVAHKVTVTFKNNNGKYEHTKKDVN